MCFFHSDVSFKCWLKLSLSYKFHILRSSCLLTEDKKMWAMVHSKLQQHCRILLRSRGLNVVLRINNIICQWRFHVVTTPLAMTNSLEVNEVCPLLSSGSCQGAEHWVLWLYQGPSTNSGRHLLSVQVNEIYAKWPGYMGIQTAYGKGY